MRNWSGSSTSHGSKSSSMDGAPTDRTLFVLVPFHTQQRTYCFDRTVPRLLRDRLGHSPPEYFSVQRSAEAYQYRSSSVEKIRKHVQQHLSLWWFRETVGLEINRSSTVRPLEGWDGNMIDELNRRFSSFVPYQLWLQRLRRKTG
jgi:hypothetical protein